MVDRAYHDPGEGRHSSQGRRRCADGENGKNNVVARASLMHGGIQGFMARTGENGEGWQRAQDERQMRCGSLGCASSRGTDEWGSRTKTVRAEGRGMESGHSIHTSVHSSGPLGRVRWGD